MTRVAAFVIRVFTALLVGLVLVAADWSRGAAQDPVRILFLGPYGVLLAANRYGSVAFPVWLFVLFLAVGVAHTETGIALWKRRPDSRVGLLLLIAGLLWLAHGFRRSSDAVAFSIGLALTNAYNPVLVQLALSIPSGHLQGRGDRALAVGSYVYSFLANVGGWLVVDHRRLLGGATPRNLLLIRDDPEAWTGLQPVLTGAAVAAGALLILVFVGRYVRGSPLYRRAFAPMWVAALAKVAGNLTWSAAIVFPRAWAYGAFFLGSGVVPAMAAVSVARSRPRERTMTHVVSLMGQALPDAFELRGMLRRATGDPSLEVLGWDPDTLVFTTLDGAPAAVELDGARRVRTVLTRQGRSVGALVHDSALADAPEVLHAVEQLAALVLENGQLVTEVSRQLDEVRRSRRRIVEAGDAERARIERNMHDAVQQRLVAAALTLRRADRNLPQEDAIDLLRQGADQVETALSELRDVVHGLNPQVVSGGLLGALESLSERSSTPVRLTSSLHSAPLPEAVAVTAYYVVAEAMTNAEKHALASLIEIDVSVETNDSGANCLLIRVRDNGLGGARFLPGRGVLGLQDRVEAFGGTLAMSSPTGGGTSLTVSLPLQTPQVDPPGRTRDPAATAAKEHPPVRHPVEIHPSSRPMNDEATAPEQEPS